MVSSIQEQSLLQSVQNGLRILRLFRGKNQFGEQ